MYIIILKTYKLIGLTNLTLYAKEHYFACTKFKQDGIYLIIAAKNQEDRIECFTRNIICKLLYGKEELTKGIIMVDLDSTDDTYEIISKLAKDYNFIKASDWNECKEIMDEISK